MANTCLSLPALAFGCLLFCQSAIAQTCTGNLLQNPGFENNLDNWEGTNPQIFNTLPSAGVKCIRLCQNASLRQTLATSAGKNLTLLFKARTETTGANKVLSYIKYLSSSWQPLVTESFDFSTTAAYTQGTVSKTAPAGAVWVEIGFLKQTVDCVLVDEVCLSESGTANPCAPDLTPPVLANCPASQNLTTANTSATATFASPTATDNCAGAVTISSNFASGAAFPLGATTVVFTAKDVANNQSTCSFSINVSQSGGGACATNLLQNGGFESGLTIWEGMGGVISTTASAGTKSLKLCQNGNIRQTLATTAGKNLTLLFKARTETTGANKVLSYIKYLSSSYQPLVTEFFDFTTSATFAQATVSKIAPTGAAWVEIGFLKQTAGCVLVDEVCLSEGGAAPQPDLTVSNFTAVKNGNLVAFNITASNIGAADAFGLGTQTGGILTGFYLSTDNVWSPDDLVVIGCANSGFQAGQTIPCIGTWDFTTIYAQNPAGNYFLIAVVDNSKIVAESNEANNAFAIPFTIGSTGGACSFVKTYFPFPFSNSSTVPNALAQSGTNLNMYVFENNGQPTPLPQIRNVKTDLDGNFVSSTATTFPANTYLNSDNLVQTSAGDFVRLDMFLGKPVFTKTAANGAVLWTSTISQYVSGVANASPQFNSLISDGTGFLAAVSASDGTVTPQIGELTLIKVDANGVFQWQKTTAGLGISFPQVNLHALSADGIFATVSFATAFKLVKFNRTNGAVLWSTQFSPLSITGIQAVLTSDGAVAVAYRDYNLVKSFIQRFDAATGAAQSASPVDMTVVFPGNAGYWRGIVATNDGGIVGALDNGLGGPAAIYTYFKMSNSLGLVWSNIFPAGWTFSPKMLATDGGILFVGKRGDDFGILKTTATGELTPQCAGACYLTVADVTAKTCNNAGTDTNPLDDTYTYMVNINSTGCAGGWTGGGTTGTFGTAKTVSGGLIDDGAKTIVFADATNPLSTIFSIKITPPAFCSNAATGCGYEISDASFGAGFNKFSSAANALNANISEKTGFPNATTTYRETNLDANGAIGGVVVQSILLAGQVSAVHFPTGNFAYCDAPAGGNISLKKAASGGSIVWTKNVAFNVPANAISGSVNAFVSMVTTNAIYLEASFQTQAAPNIAPVQFNFIIKTDVDGVKISETPLPSWSLSDYQNNSLRLIGSDGSYFIERFKSGIGWSLFKVNVAGTKLWDIGLLGDPPSSSLKRIEFNAGGTALFVTTFSNSQSAVAKINAATGVLDWSKSIGLAFASLAQDGYFENVNVRNGAATADGGIVVAFNFADYFSIAPFQATGFIYGKISPNGNMVWAKKDLNIGVLTPAIGTADGGVIFAGVKTTGANWTFMKLNSLGELTPSCGSTTLPDLTLANLNVAGTSVAVGAVLNFNFDLKNLGGVAATGNFTIKSCLSTDNVLSANDIQNGSVPTGNLPAGATLVQVLGALTVPAGTAAGNYFVILKVDADGTISESNENNNVLASASPISVTAGGGTGADLEVTLTADKTTVAQWSNVTYTLTAKNAGNVTITNAVIQVNGCNGVGFFPFAQSFGLVYASTPGAPTKGTFNFVSQQWTLPNLAAGQSATLAFTLFALTTAEKKVVAQSVQQSPTDPDSQPTTGISNLNCTPAQDDEAAWTINLGQAGQAVVPQSSGESSDKAADFAVFPNPTGGFCSIELSQFFGKKLEIAVTDILGKTVFFEKTDELKTATIDLDLSAQMAGVYFIKISAEGQRTIAKKLIINKL